MKNGITVLIYTHNEQDNIVDCIKSVKQLSHNILVIDMESTDNTLKLAEKQAVKNLVFPYSRYVEPAREFGIKQVETEWVFIMDADERMTKELAEEIKIKTNEIFSYYRIPRKNIFGKSTCLPTGRWLKHGGWWPDYQIRLIRVADFVTWPKQIHSTPDIKGKCGFLTNPFLHYFHGNIEEMVKKTVVFENIESDLLFNANKQVSTSTFFRKFFGELFRRLFKEKGFMDGPVGIIESIYQAYSKTITYIYLYEKKVRSV